MINEALTKQIKGPEHVPYKLNCSFYYDYFTSSDYTNTPERQVPERIIGTLI